MVVQLLGEGAAGNGFGNGVFVAIWVGVPALVLLLLWLTLQDTVIDRLVLASLPPAMTEGASSSQISLISWKIAIRAPPRR